MMAANFLILKYPHPHNSFPQPLIKNMSLYKPADTKGQKHDCFIYNHSPLDIKESSEKTEECKGSKNHNSTGYVNAVFNFV